VVTPSPVAPLVHRPHDVRFVDRSAVAALDDPEVFVGIAPGAAKLGTDRVVIGREVEFVHQNRSVTLVKGADQGVDVGRRGVRDDDRLGARAEQRG
jgi:hypothetical protein